MRQVVCRLVFEVDEARGGEDKDQDQRDHHIIVEAATLIRPENIALDEAPHARHSASLNYLQRISNQVRDRRHASATQLNGSSYSPA